MLLQSKKKQKIQHEGKNVEQNCGKYTFLEICELKKIFQFSPISIWSTSTRHFRALTLFTRAHTRSGALYADRVIPE